MTDDDVVPLPFPFLTFLPFPFVLFPPPYFPRIAFNGFNLSASFGQKIFHFPNFSKMHPSGFYWGRVVRLPDGPFKGFRLLQRPKSFFQNTMDEKGAFVHGVTFKTRFPDGGYKTLAAPVSNVTLISGGITTGRKGKKKMALMAKIGNKKHTLRYQTPPLTLSKKREIKKWKSIFTVLDWDYLSQLDPLACAKCKQELADLDKKAVSLIYANATTLWPDEEITFMMATERYEGFTTPRKWTPPPAPATESGEASEPRDNLKDAIIEDIDSNDPKLVYEPKGESKKRKQMDEQPTTMEFPAQLSIFPSSKKDKPCKVFSMDGKAVLLSSVTTGIEASNVFEIGLVEDNGKVQVSCTGLQINLKEDHREPSSYLAQSFYVPDNEE